MTTASRIADAVGPTVASNDTARDLIAALAEGQSCVDVLIRPADGADPADLLDPDTAPVWLLPLLVAMSGSRIDPSRWDEQKVRDRIMNTPARKRGTPAAIRSRLEGVLTGSKSYNLVERDGDPAHLRVEVYESQTPSVEAVREAVLREKPLGLKLFVDVFSGATYDHLAVEHGPTYDDDAAEWPTISDMIDHVPS
jgi:hypothetical protein